MFIILGGLSDDDPTPVKGSRVQLIYAICAVYVLMYICTL